MKHHYIDEIKAIIIFAVAVILLASLISFVPEDLPWYTSQPNVPARNLIRVFGAYVAGGLFFVFGYGAYFFVIAMLFLAWDKFSMRALSFSWPKMASLGVMFCVVSALFGMFGVLGAAARFQRAGLVGSIVSDFLVRYFGRVGALVILSALGALSVILVGEFLLSPLVFRASHVFKEWCAAARDGLRKRRAAALMKKPQVKTQPAFVPRLPRVSTVTRPTARVTPLAEPAQDAPAAPVASVESPPPPKIRIAATPGAKEQRPEGAAGTEALAPKPAAQVDNYQLPSLELLADPPPVSSRKIQDDLMSGARVLEETLSDFNVSVRVADIEQGPIITRYELEPAPGVKVQKITALSDDIALAMKAQAVRIVAPIPGKNRVGVEVPNSLTSLVYLKDVLAARKPAHIKSKLTLALGKDTAGVPLFADLADMPHLLIAGTTGSGKTVCVNSLIMSILFNATPQEVKFLMVDPKMVELALYNKLPHALCPSVTDPKKVSAALSWVVGEMESRYALFADEGVRNIKEYNAKEQRLPYIVVIIDELADLMQLAAKQIESAITRLSQLSRAVGIHLVLATQRPSVDVITGVIKANFPARISFKVASKVDSRTVLDMNGAEKLLGKGDMLFMKPGDAKPIRGQCSLVADEEIQKVISFISGQQEPTYDDNVLKKQSSAASGEITEKDDLYDEALRLVIETNQASVSILQRRMRLGYTRAARLIDMMEQDGVIGPYCGSKPREILVNREEWLMQHMGDDNKT